MSEALSNSAAARIRQARCFPIYAIAPKGFSAAQANQTFNEFVADRSLPLAIYHDHFIGQPGGVAIFYISDAEERDVLLESVHLADWQLAIQPLIFSRSPAAFDEQIAFTLRAYRDADWEQIQLEKRPIYGDPGREAETAVEISDEED